MCEPAGYDQRCKIREGDAIVRQALPIGVGEIGRRCLVHTQAKDGVFMPVITALQRLS